MIYEFRCFGCDKLFEVAKPVSRYREDELCTTCGCIAERVPFPRKTYLNNTAVQEKSFNHGLGIACTPNEAKRIAKEKGLIEVGNENVHKAAKRTSEQLDQKYDAELESVWKGA